MKVVAWDFDGVLNRTIVDGRFIWADSFEADTGQSRAVFEAHVFGRDLEEILTGREDLRDRVASWAATVGYEPGADALLEYWFAKDTHPDARMIGLMDRLNDKGIHQVIATNNEARRADYIENEMGYGVRVERIFASGRIGAAKPSAGFFNAVTDALDVLPSDILLIDDLAKNVEAASDLGWQAFHFTDESHDDIERALPL